MKRIIEYRRLLDITPNADLVELKTTYRNLIKEWHPDKYIDEAWNEMILDFPIENINILVSLKSKYRTFLLSNTNEIHYIFYNKILQTQFKINNLSNPTLRIISNSIVFSKLSIPNLILFILT